MTTAGWYNDFADRQARGVSPAYERLARAVAGDDEVLGLLDTVPPPKRQPNLLFAVVRWLGGPVGDYASFRTYVTEQWPQVEAQLRVRATQTNEIGRSALLLPVLAALPQPLALIEVGASAGLNLFPDRWSYAYGGSRIGSGGPLLECAATGISPPAAPPRVVWHAGLDLNPLDITDAADRSWLEALIWPEHEDRRERLRAAEAIAAADPPRIVRGDLVDDLPALVAAAPEDATKVVFHTSVLYQVPAERREAFVALARSLPVRWIAVEDPDVLPYAGLPAPPADGLHKNVLALDGKPLAWTEGHGRGLSWFGGPLQAVAMADEDRPARVEDIHELATALPDVVVGGDNERPEYSVGRKAFVFFRSPRKDAVDPATGERYTDVIAFSVESEDDKQALVRDESTPFFTTPHFDGYATVLLLARDIGGLTRAELAEIVQDAWLARAPKRKAAAWRAGRPV